MVSLRRDFTRRLLTAFLFVGLSGFYGNALAQADNAARMAEAKACYERADELFAQGKFEESIEYYQKAARITKDKSLRQFVRTAKRNLAQLKKEERKNDRRLARENRRTAKLAKRGIREENPPVSAVVGGKTKAETGLDKREARRLARAEKIKERIRIREERKEERRRHREEKRSHRKTKAREEALQETEKELIPAPAVEEKAPVSETKAPVVEEKAPAVEEEAPVAEEKAPAVEEKVPSGEEKTPAVEEEKPAAGEKAPAVEEKISPPEEKSGEDAGTDSGAVKELSPEEKPLPWEPPLPGEGSGENAPFMEEKEI